MQRGPAAVFLVFVWSCSSSATPAVEQGKDDARDGDNGSEDVDAGTMHTGDGDGESAGDKGDGDEGDEGSNGNQPDEDAGDDAPGGGSISPLPCDDPFEVQGLHGCLTTVDGTQVKFFPLDEGRKVQNLAVYLHQDTAWEWTSNDAFPTIVKWAMPRGIMVIAPLAPRSDEGDPEYGAVGTVEPVNQLGALIETFRDAYGASRERIYYWGGSGGSWFMAFWFIPQMGERLPGIFVASCGGDISNPYDAWTWDPAADTDTRSRITLYFNYGSEDFLAPNIEAGIEDYRKRDFEVDSLVHPGAQHCQHEIDQPTIDFWSRHL